MTKARDLANASTALSAVSATELGYVDGVTSAIQTQLNAKQAVVSGVDDTEIGYLNGVTSAVQTQLDAKIAKTLTSTTGDIIYASGANTPARLGIGSSAQVLTVASGVPSWATPASGGGMTLLSTTNTSTGSSYTVSSISADYINLLLMWTGACTAGASLTISFAGGNSSGGGVKEDGVLTTWTATNAKLMPDTQGAGNVVSCLITNYKESAEKTLQIAFGGVNTGWRGGAAGGFLSYTSAISTFTITLSTGSFSSGSLRVFGVK